MGCDLVPLGAIPSRSRWEADGNVSRGSDRINLKIIRYSRASVNRVASLLELFTVDVNVPLAMRIKDGILTILRM